MKQIITLPILMLCISLAFAQKRNYQYIFAETKAANDASLQGHIQKDVAKICAVYTPDAIILPPDMANPIIGLPAIKKYYTNSLKAGQSLKITTENIRYEVIDENHVNEIGSYVITYQANGSAFPQDIKGHMLIVWERNAEREWKIKFDMWH